MFLMKLDNISKLEVSENFEKLEGNFWNSNRITGAPNGLDS
jgi:hypothetical protein